MKLLRRQLLHLVAGAAALPAVSRFALALDYPTRPIHAIVGYPPGSGPDIEARLIGQWLSERLGQPFIVENRPGAASNLATEAVVHAPPPPRRLQPPPGRVRGRELCHRRDHLRRRRQAQFQFHPRHRAGRQMVDLMSGQVQVGFSVVTETIEHIKSGKLRALAVTTAARSEVLPDIPTIGEFVPGYEASAWVGIDAPRNTPTKIIEKLNADINAGLTDPKLKARFAELGATVFVGSPADFGRFIADETEKWGKVVKFAGIKPN